MRKKIMMGIAVGCFAVLGLYSVQVNKNNPEASITSITINAEAAAESSSSRSSSGRRPLYQGSSGVFCCGNTCFSSCGAAPC